MYQKMHIFLNGAHWEQETYLGSQGSAWAQQALIVMVSSNSE
jgi:hypothetical protein